MRAIDAQGESLGDGGNGRPPDGSVAQQAGDGEQAASALDLVWFLDDASERGQVLLDGDLPLALELRDIAGHQTAAEKR